MIFIRVTGYIQVVNLDTALVLGYLTPKNNDFGEYGYFQSTTTGALQVSISYQLLDDTPVDITALNPIDGLSPFFGGSECLSSVDEAVILTYSG